MLILPRRKPPLAIEDVFLANLRTGNGSTQTITGGPDMSGEGGLVISKRRDSAADWGWFDTERGATKLLSSNTTAAETTDADTLTAFTSDGATFGADAKFNTSSATYIDYLIRKAPGFHDTVEYTGTGTAQNISHNLGSVPGMIVVKRRDSTGDWIVYHRSNTANPETDYLQLNGINATVDLHLPWNDTAPTSTQFTVGTDADVNASSATYVAYLFAHDDSDNGLIQCGSYTGNGSTTGPTITTGHETQWLLVKRTDSTGDWRIYDSVRDATNPRTYKLLANSSAAEDTAGEDIDFNATNFQIKSTDAGINASGGTYIYVEIKAAA